MPNVPKLKQRDVVRVVKKVGFRLARNNGPHAVYEKAGRPNVYIPRHAEITPGVTRDICRAAGVTVEWFLGQI